MIVLLLLRPLVTLTFLLATTLFPLAVTPLPPPPPINTKDLWGSLEEETWKLMDSMPECVNAVIRRKGGAQNTSSKKYTNGLQELLIQYH